MIEASCLANQPYVIYGDGGYVQDLGELRAREHFTDLERQVDIELVHQVHIAINLLALRDKK